MGEVHWLDESHLFVKGEDFAFTQDGGNELATKKFGWPIKGITKEECNKSKDVVFKNLLVGNEIVNAFL